MSANAANRRIKVVGGYDHHASSSPVSGSTPTGRRLGASGIARSPTVAGGLKAKVDLSGLDGGAVAGPSTPPVARAKATPDGLRTVRARGLTSIATPPNGTAASSTTPKALAGRMAFGGESAVPLSSGSAPVTPVPSQLTRSSAPSQSLAPLSSGPPKSKASLSAANSPSMPTTIRASRSVLGIDTGSSATHVRRASVSGSALAALSTSETPPPPASRGKSGPLLPSPSISSISVLSPPRSPVPSKRTSRPASPATGPRSTSPSTLHPVRSTRSPTHRSSGSSTLSGLSTGSSVTSTWAKRNSVSRSSRSSDGDLEPSGITGRLEKAEVANGWVETEAERLARIEREAAEAELKEREGEAKVNRKILDLEIQNASLLAINATLERTKLKQASEIRDLRRRMRDRSLAPISSASPGLLSPVSGEGFFDDDGSDDDGPEVDLETLVKEDERFADVARLLEALIHRASDAVAYQPSERDLSQKKVLNRVEMEDKLAEAEARGLGLEMQGFQPAPEPVRDSLASRESLASTVTDASSRDSSPEAELK